MFRGRKSEVINVGGVKVHPLPVEDRITGLDCVALGPRLRAAQQADRRHRRRRDRAGGRRRGLPTSRRSAHEIKEAVADLPRAWQPRSVTFVDAIETKGGKTIRGMED